MVVTDVGGLKETIGDRGTGLVASEGTPDAVRDEILKYFENSSVKEGCIAAIRQEKERLSWKSFADRLLEFAGTL